MGVFENCVVIVTGASRALAARYASRSRRDVLPRARRAQRGTVAESARECARPAQRRSCIARDVTSAESCRSLVDATVSRFGTIDVLVNDAGGTMWTPFEQVEDLTIFDRLMQLNYLGSVYPTYFALPHLRRSRGRLVAVASVAGLVGVPTRTAYSAAKHAVVGFFDSLRIELDGSGVSVTVICPDFVLSEIHRRALGGDGRPLGRSPLQEAKIMTAERCAELMIDAMAARRRILITSRRGRLGRWLGVVAPSLIDRVAAKAIRDGR